jgi:hypothetical protein
VVAQARPVAPREFDDVGGLARRLPDARRAREHVLLFVIDEAGGVERGPQARGVSFAVGQRAERAVGGARPRGARVGRVVRLAARKDDVGARRCGRFQGGSRGGFGLALDAPLVGRVLNRLEALPAADRLQIIGDDSIGRGQLRRGGLRARRLRVRRRSERERED